METFNPTTLKAFRSEFEKATKALAEKYGVSITIGNIQYTPTNFSTRMTVKKVEKAASGVTVPVLSTLEHALANEAAYASDVEFVGKNILGSVWRYKGADFMVEAYNPRKPKNCWQLKKLTDGSFAQGPSGWLKRSDVRQMIKK